MPPIVFRTVFGQLLQVCGGMVLHQEFAGLAAGGLRSVGYLGGVGMLVAGVALIADFAGAGGGGGRAVGATTDGG